MSKTLSNTQSKPHSYRCVIIGGGTIGSILIKGCVELSGPENVSVIEHSADRCVALRDQYGVQAVQMTDESAEHILATADVILFAVKPQDFSGAAENINALLQSGEQSRIQSRLQSGSERVADQPLIVSVMAGIGIDMMQTTLNMAKIIRTMPNTPAKIGLGMTVWTHTESVAVEEQEFIRQLLQSFGTEMMVSSDDDIDKATAVSGSGPAYVFFFAEQLIQAAENLGFTSEQATQLVTQTLVGASTLLTESAETPSNLRTLVTSKGGTTEAAIQSVPHDQLQKIWTEAVQSAYQRAQELRSA